MAREAAEMHCYGEKKRLGFFHFLPTVTHETEAGEWHSVVGNSVACSEVAESALSIFGVRADAQRT
jgi:hypothetical protein